MKLWIDTETRSPTSLKAAGTVKYAQLAEVIIVTWRVDDGSERCWDCTASPTPPEDLLYAIEECDEIWAFNAFFDRTLLETAAPWWPKHHAPLSKWHCVMAQCFAHGLPGSLDHLCEVFQVPEHLRKLKGKDYIHLFCVPRGDGRYNDRHSHPVEWAEFLAYATRDIPAMVEVHRHAPKWNLPIVNVEWPFDQMVNDRGFAVDVEFAEAAVRATTKEKKRLSEQTLALTDDFVKSTTQRDRLLGYLLIEYGVELPDLKADTIERRLEDPELPEFVKELLRIRLQASKSSTTKYSRVLKMEVGGRLFGTLQYCAANRTGRWGGRGFQPHNLQRPTHKFPEILVGIDAMKAEVEDLITDNVMALAASCMRSVIIAPPGKKLCVADLSNIEGRKIAWLAGEQWKLDAFAAYDRKEGEDLYKISYARSFGVDPRSVEDDSDERQIGKVCLAGDTMVLCESGWKRIDSVSLTDKVWDGDKWAEHRGLAYNGKKPVMKLCGISLTPDHLVWSGSHWLQARSLAASPENIYQALVSGAEKLPLQATWRANATGLKPSSLSATAANLSTWWRATTSKKGLLLGVMSALRKLLAESGIGGTLRQCATMSTAGGYSTALLRPSPDVPVHVTKATVTTVREESAFSPSGLGTEPRFLNIYRPFRDGTIPTLKWIGLITMAITNRVIYALLPTKLTRSINGSSESLRQNVPVYDLLSVGSKNRFTVLSKQGPLLVHNCELALGYAGGVNAFVTMAATYGVDLELLAEKAGPTIPRDVLRDAQRVLAWAKQNKRTLGLSDQVYVVCEALKQLWRNAHPKIEQLWADYEHAAFNAIMYPGEVFEAGRCVFDRKKAWLRIRLPSGRYLCYPSPQIDNGKISYMGVNVYNKRWHRITTYGGKIAENITQASSRDILADAMPRAEAAGYSVILTVHDEVNTETPDLPEFTAKRLSQILSTNPAWAPGIPLSAKGFETKRYKKS